MKLVYAGKYAVIRYCYLKGNTTYLTGKFLFDNNIFCNCILFLERYNLLTVIGLCLGTSLLSPVSIHVWFDGLTVVFVLCLMLFGQS